MNRPTSLPRVLIVAHYYPPHHGGIERVAQNQARRLAALGHEVTVVSSKVAPDQVSGFVDGVNVQRVIAWNGLEKHGIPFPLIAPRLVPLIWKEAGNADIVHVHDVFYLSSLAAAVCACLRRRPVVLTQHVDMVPHSSALVNWVEKIVYATSGRFIFNISQTVMVLNERVAAFVRTQGVKPDRVMILPNGTDCQLFAPVSATEKKRLRQKFGLPIHKNIGLFVGRAVPKKGYDKVVAADSDDYVLVFAGGEFSHDDTPRLKFLGQMPQEQLAQLYKAADAFVLPSTGEGFPLAVQEALASGLPTVVLDDPIYNDLKPDKVLVLRNNTSASINKELLSLLADTSRRRNMAAKARAYAEANYPWDRLVARLVAVYDEAIATYKANNETA